MNCFIDEQSTACFDLNDLIPVGHITMDPQGIIVEVDMVAAHLIGSHCDTLVNMPIAKIISFEDLDIFYHHLWKLYETGNFHCFELCMIKSDGTNLFIFMQAAAAPDSVGASTVHISFFETNTQKEALRVLRASEEKNRIIAENNPDIIWIYNMNQKRYIFFSSQIQNLLGYTVEEALTLSMESLMTPDSYTILSEQFSKTLGHFVIDPETPRKYVNEIKQTCKNGKNIWVEVVTQYQFNPLHEIEVFGTTRKITEQKEAEYKLMKERELVRNMLLFLPSGIILTDDLGIVTFVNSAAEHLSGYGINEVNGKEYDKIFESFNLLTKEKQPNPVRYVLETGKCFSSVQNSGLIRKDGTEIHCEYTASPIPANDGKITGVVVAVRDLTKEYELETEIAFSDCHDILTGLFNRRFWDQEIKRMDTADDLPISIIMGDINSLKQVNDVFGREKGDELIIRIAGIIESSCRPEDLVTRWGGDEFMIFLPKTSVSEAGRIMERILANCSGTQINAIPVGIAFGMDTKTEASEILSDVIRKAEDSMYIVKAKEYERNGTEIIDTIAHRHFENDPYEKQHAKRVSTLCTKIAQAIGLPEKEVEKISMEGLLHDIGKAGINKTILQKPGSLTQEERKAVSLHSEIGYKIVGLSQNMIDIGNAIRAHHERVDGKGYPNGMQSTDIPVGAKIISIADSYDTMTCQTLYRKIMSKDEAIVEIRRNEGTQFDPEIAEAFIEKVLQFRVPG